MNAPSLTPAGLEFLARLNDAVGGDPAGQASMYDLGSDLGLDRAAAEDVLGELLAEGLAEIRSLSGQVGLTAAGRALAAQHSPKAAGPTDRPDSMEDLIKELREGAKRMGLNTRDEADLLADLNTIVAQQASSRSKATVINACLRFIADLLTKATDPKARTMAERVKKALHS